MRPLSFVTGIFFFFAGAVQAAEEYTIADEFDGCEYGKLYELLEGLILECQEYNYFYDYMPRVIASGREVIIIGDEKVEGIIHDGTVYKTAVNGDFEGCDFGKRYRFTNGLVFECNTYSYTYSYFPDVKIFVVAGRSAVVFIDGEKYDGTLFRTR